MKLRKLASFLDKSHLRPLLAACMPARGIVGLNYHRIGDGSRSELDRGLWSASEEGFDQQLAWLKLNSDVISPAEIDLARKDSSGRHVLITFDDGYKDNYDCAVPTLRRHGLTATFFIATGFIDDPRLAWWDEIASQIRRTDRDEIDLPQWLPQPQRLVVGQREAVIRTMLRKFKSLPGDQAKRFLADLRDATQASPPSLHHEDLWMSWDMLREMDAAGMTIGGHTVNHIVLSGSSAAEQWTEISTCAARIETEIGKRMDYFSYPVGNRNSFNQDSIECLRKLGVAYAFSYYGGFAGINANRYDMPRVAIEPYIDRGWFRAIVELPRLFGRPQDAIA
ncbi:MAG TPA: polysaccharide deacetylase family protein [Thauera sp.]|nr:polysaccharide deacetylase family protein [Thauera sp.]HQZ62605.1 polysaccharide deacetylase family protein [Dokdonella sp.]